MWSRAALFLFAVTLLAQSKRNPPPPPLTPLAELEGLGASIALLVEAKDWEALIALEATGFRDRHRAELENPKSDTSCFLVDTTDCPSSWPRPSVYHILARAHFLSVSAVALNADTAILFFYDRSEIPPTALRSQKFLCEGGWKKVAFWTFRNVNGKWRAVTPLFDAQSDALCVDYQPER